MTVYKKELFELIFTQYHEDANSFMLFNKDILSLMVKRFKDKIKKIDLEDNYALMTFLHNIYDNDKKLIKQLLKLKYEPEHHFISIVYLNDEKVFRIKVWKYTGGL